MLHDPFWLSEDLHCRNDRTKIVAHNREYLIYDRASIICDYIRLANRDRESGRIALDCPSRLQIASHARKARGSLANNILSRSYRRETQLSKRDAVPRVRLDGAASRRGINYPRFYPRTCEVVSQEASNNVGRASVPYCLRRRIYGVRVSAKSHPLFPREVHRRAGTVKILMSIRATGKKANPPDAAEVKPRAISSDSFLRARSRDVSPRTKATDENGERRHGRRVAERVVCRSYAKI